MAQTLGDITKELSEKVLAPARAEAANLIENAKNEVETLMADAQAEAEKIKNQAKAEAEERRRQMDADLQTAARNFVLMVQEKLEAAVVQPVVDEEVKSVLSDCEFIKKMIEIIMAELPKQHGREQHFEVLLPEQHCQELEKWFLQKFKDKTMENLTVHFSDKISYGFRLGAENEGARFNFGSGLTEAFVDFCSPRFRKYFFPSEVK